MLPAASFPCFQGYSLRCLKKWQKYNPLLIKEMFFHSPLRY